MKGDKQEKIYIKYLEEKQKQKNKQISNKTLFKSNMRYFGTQANKSN